MLSYELLMHTEKNKNSNISNMTAMFLFNIRLKLTFRSLQRTRTFLSIVCSYRPFEILAAAMSKRERLFMKDLTFLPAFFKTFER